jgi:hypothetical protein
MTISQQMTIASAQREAGAVSIRNSKMPGSSFAVSATKCNVGAKLAKIEGSTCHKCYALKLEKLRPSVAQGWGANYLKATGMIERAPKQWATAMAFQVTKAAEKTGEAYHRWFDGGDVASLEMLLAIAMVCELTPHIKHWLPTREAAIVKAFLRQRDLPANLTIRVSSTMIDDKPIAGHANTSTVHKAVAHVGHACPARHQGNMCGSCRACWSREVKNVSYPLH